MKIAVIGTGIVGRTLALKLKELNHEIMIGTRNVSDKLADKTSDYQGNPPFGDWLKANSTIKLGTFDEAAKFGEMIINATNGRSSISALTLAGKKNLAG